MKYRRLGRTNLKVSVVGVGTWQYGGEWGKAFTQAEVNIIFEAARETGINLIDTAECYGDHTSEALIGHAIKTDRADWVLASKFGHVFHGHLDRTDARGPADVRPQVEASLRALQTDYLDLLQYHSVRDEEFLDEAVRDEIARLVHEGKVRFVGNSISSAGSAVQPGQSRAFNVDVLQVIYNRLDRRPEQGTPSLFDIARRDDLGLLARVPLASGLLGGKYQPGDVFPLNDVRAGHPAVERDEKLRQVRTIAATELPTGVDLPTWALAWCLQHPAVSAVIPGCKSAQQLMNNAAAADLDMVRGDHPQAWR